ncbi:hypothetical protein [Sulfurimonas sp.]
MCIPHGAAGTKSNGYIETNQEKKHVKMVSKDEFEHGDPDFIDERVKPYTKSSKKSSFFASLFGV